jgi:hypothetical protein
MGKTNLSEELRRMKSLMVYKNGEHKDYLYEYELLKEDDGNTKVVPLTTNFGSGMWKTLPKSFDSDLQSAVDFIKTKQEEIKKRGGKITSGSKVLIVQVEAGESQVPNKNGEVDPPKKVEPGWLSNKRSETITKYLTKFFTNLVKNGTIAEMPTFQEPLIKFGATPWDPPEGATPEQIKKLVDDPKYTAEQYIKVLVKFVPPTACLEGLTIDVIYNRNEDGDWPCRGGHVCDDAKFNVLLNGVAIGVANLNNANDGGSRMSSFTITPEQAVQIIDATSDSSDGNILISFKCANSTGRCHSSTPEIRISRGKSKTTIYHACTPSISEVNDYNEIKVMKLDACGNIIEKGSEKKAAQKDAQLMNPPAGLKKGWLVYDIATKTAVFKPSSAATDLSENMYKKYLPLYHSSKYEAGQEPEIYQGKCNEPKIYNNWCIWKGLKVKYKNDAFCNGAEMNVLYLFGSESNQYPGAGKNITESMRNYLLDNCESSNLELTANDVIRVSKDNLPDKFSFKRLYAPQSMTSNPKILGDTGLSPFKLVPNEKPNKINFTPKDFIDFVKNINGPELPTIDLNKITKLMSKATIKDLSDSSNLITFVLLSKEEDLGSSSFPNAKKIDSYLSKYNTYKNEKFSGLVLLGNFTKKTGFFWGISVWRRYEKGIFMENKIYVKLHTSTTETIPSSTIASLLTNLKLIQIKKDHLVLV